MGGNGDRVLRLAATHADIVGFTGLGNTRADGQQHDAEWAWDQIDAKVAVVRNAAADRFDELELNALVQQIEITPDRRTVIEATAARVGGDHATMLRAPYLLVGTVQEIIEQLHHARQRWGFTYFVTRSAEPTGRIIESL